MNEVLGFIPVYICIFGLLLAFLLEAMGYKHPGSDFLIEESSNVEVPAQASEQFNNNKDKSD